MKHFYHYMKNLFILLVFLCHCALAQAQVLKFKEFFERTSMQCMICPSEKVYLHTDRSVYMAGDSIWMRAHVVDGICHAPRQESGFVYATLQNPFLETIALVRMKADEQGHIHGYIKLPDDLPKGEYSLCAYTQFMENFDSEYFFKKRITINNVLNKSIRLDASRRGSHLDVRFINPVTGEMQNVQNCSARVSDGNIAIHRQDSGYSIKFYNSKDRVVLIQAGNYREFVDVGVKPDYDVSFLPEGGQLVAGEFNRLAFKSINSLGQGEDIVGTLRDERDSVLMKINSFYRGMGSVTFRPEWGKKYFVVCENAAGVQKRFELPAATDGCTLWVNEVKGKVYAKVLFSPHKIHSKDMQVYALQRGWPVAVGKWKKKTLGLVCDKDEFIEGIATFVVVNGEGRIVSERLLFIHKDEQVKGTVYADRPQPGNREKVSLTVEVPEKDWEGDCSVSVVDNRDVLPDSCENILTSLLLTSDLRGYIEDPGWYFEKDENDTLDLRRRALDALMMTQGWRKYELEKAWTETYKLPQSMHEQSLEISGKVTSNVARSPISNAKVQLMVPNMGFSKNVQTDAWGRFTFNNFDAPDSTVYWVKALSDEGKDKVTLQVDTVVHPVLKTPLLPYRDRVGSGIIKTSYEYLEKADLKALNEQGIRHYFMDEVMVTAPQIKPRTEYERTGNVLSIREEAIEQSGTQDVYNLLKQKIPGLSLMYIKGEPLGGITMAEFQNVFATKENEKENEEENEEEKKYLSIGIRGDETTLIVDGAIYRKGLQLEVLKTLNKRTIAQIDMVRPPSSLVYDPMSFGGVIAITTKQGGGKYNASWAPTNLKTIMPLGFQKPAEFYVPRYDLIVDKESKNPDLRTTIHWQPHLSIQNGKGQIEFYTADGPVDYSVVIEGVGKDGRLLRVEEKIK